MLANDLTIANAILDEADRQELSLTPMQLQKLLYFTNGWHMKIYYGESILSEPFEAWQFGPVIRDIYDAFKRFGSRKITGRAENSFNGKVWRADLDLQQSLLIQEVVKMYGSLSGPTLSHLTHKDGTPWSQTWQNGSGHGDEIDKTLILDEFEKIRSPAVTARCVALT